MTTLSYVCKTFLFTPQLGSGIRQQTKELFQDIAKDGGSVLPATGEDLAVLLEFGKIEFHNFSFY